MNLAYFRLDATQASGLAVGRKACRSQASQVKNGFTVRYSRLGIKHAMLRELTAQFIFRAGHSG